MFKFGHIYLERIFYHATQIGTIKETVLKTVYSALRNIYPSLQEGCVSPLLLFEPEGRVGVPLLPITESDPEDIIADTEEVIVGSTGEVFSLSGIF